MIATAIDMAALVRSGRVTAQARARSALERIGAHDDRVHAFTTVLAHQALADADAIDAAVAGGRDPGPLAGVPFAVKNLYDIAGVTTVAGSRILRDAAPTVRDATAVARLRAAGAVLVGALNMDEFAYGFVTENYHDGPTRNPHAPVRIAGGSSGGSAAAVAAGFVPITLGSDTNGSIRVPAALCGVWGLKPTFGRLSRAGTFPFVADLDHVGPFARTVADLAAAYDVLQGPDERDPACQGRAVEPASPGLDEERLGDERGRLRVGVLRGWFAEGCSRAALAAVERVAAAFPGARDVVLPGAEAARSAAFCLTAAQGGEWHRARLAARPFDFDPAVRDRLFAGLLLPAATLTAVRRVRRRFADEVAAAFAEFDVLLAPTTPFPASPIGQATEVIDGADIPVRANLGLYTQPLSFVGLPVVAAPVLDAGPLPLGVQIVGAPWDEAGILRVAAGLERLGVCGAWPVPGNNGPC